MRDVSLVLGPVTPTIRLVPMGQILNVGLPLYARSRPWMVKHWPTNAGLPLQRGGPANDAARSNATNAMHIISAFVRIFNHNPAGELLWGGAGDLNPHEIDRKSVV